MPAEILGMPVIEVLPQPYHYEAAALWLISLFFASFVVTTALCEFLQHEISKTNPKFEWKARYSILPPLFIACIITLTCFLRYPPPPQCYRVAVNEQTNLTALYQQYTVEDSDSVTIVIKEKKHQ